MVPGYKLRIVDGNHLPASEKRLKPLRGFRGVHEQAVSIEDDQGKLIRLRRVELHLAHPAEDGATVIRLLTNLPAWEFSARSVARVHRFRWKIESLFQRLEAVLHSEVQTLGHPRAALFAFGVAVMAYNVLAVLQSAAGAARELQHDEIELSSYCFADEIRAHYAGMIMAVIPTAWKPCDRMSAARMAEVLL